MTTQLGPAVINVKLNVATAMEELDKIEDRLKNMGRIELKAVERERETQKEEKAQDDKRPAAEAKTKQGRFAMKVMAAVGAVAGGALLVEKGFPVLGAAVEAVGKKSGIGLVEDFAKEINAKMQGLADTVSDLAAKVQVALPTARQVSDVTRARLLLGEAPSMKETLDLSGILYQVNEVTSRAERQRDKVAREAIGNLIGEVLGGGLGK